MVPSKSAGNAADQLLVHRTDQAARIGSVLEVLVAFVAVHVAYRSFKHFTWLGHREGAAHVNFSPGAVMILATVLLVILAGRSFADYGLTARNWQGNLNIGLVGALLVATGAGLLAALNIRPNHPVVPPRMAEGVISGIGALILTLILALILKRDRKVFHAPWPVALLVLAIVAFVTPLAIVASLLMPVLLMVLWTVFGAGFGEEIFYRGYVQSRVDIAWGKPFHVPGVNFGAGLIVSSLLFGLLHALNTVDYFRGRFDSAWDYGIQSIFAGLYYGVLRERTGTIFAGAITHGVVDVLARVPPLMH